MILNPAQGRGVLKLLFVCGYHFSRQLGMHNASGVDAPDIDEMMGVFRQVWGPDGNRHLVDRLVDENPIGLTRSELAIVSQWRECVYGRFTVHAEGSDVYYLIGDYAIEVRGPIKEPDRFDGYPQTYVETLLLPFDGAVIYGGWIKDLSGTAGEARLGLSRATFSEAQRAGHVVHTERQFVEAAPRIRELVGLVGLDEADERAVGPDVPPRVGALAGLTWEERERVMTRDLEGDMKNLYQTIMRDRLDEMVTRGRPTTSLTEIMGRLRKNELQSICDSAGLRYTRSMNKAALVDLALESVPRDGEALWRHLVFMGPKKVMGMRDLIAAKGRIDVAVDDIDGLLRLPFDAFPLVALFRSGGVFSVVVSDEVRHAMEMGNYDRVVRRAEGFDRACSYALISAEFRGVVPLEDLTQECIDLLGLREDPIDIAMAIAMRVDLYDLSMDIVELDREPFLVSGGLVYYENAHELGEWETNFAYEILDRHEEVAPKPLARLVTEYGYKDWMEYLFAQRATRELVGYLDAHVPEHQSDLGFAEQFVEDLSMLLAMNDPDDYDRQRAFKLLEEFGLVVPDEDRGLVAGLIDGFVDVAPNWYANGWPITGRRLQLV